MVSSIEIKTRISIDPEVVPSDLAEVVRGAQHEAHNAMVTRTINKAQALGFQVRVSPARQVAVGEHIKIHTDLDLER